MITDLDPYCDSSLKNMTIAHLSKAVVLKVWSADHWWSASAP